MTWIRVVSPGPHAPDVGAALAEAVRGYPPEYAASAGDERLPQAVREDSIVLSHSLIPDAMRHFFAGYAALLDPSLPLSRRQHEMIATTVSALNRCFY
jgi:hypothetical protein